MSERDWIEGNRAAWRALLEVAITHLDADASTEHVRAERERARAALRRFCVDHGDNDWPDTLDLEDIIEKHLRWKGR
jgi:hypothetical protein